MKRKPVIAMTMGDPAGIGPEIVVKVLKDKKIRSACRPVLFGDMRIFRKTAKSLDAGIKFHKIGEQPRARGSHIVDCIEPHEGVGLSRITPGTINKACGAAAVRFVEAGTRYVLKGKANALVTAPVNKEAMWAKIELSWVARSISLTNAMRSASSS